MKIYFENSAGKSRLIANLDGDYSDALGVINEFCLKRAFKVPYIRVFNTEFKAKPATQFDVGSHSEFFYVVPAFNLDEVYYE